MKNFFARATNFFREDLSEVVGAYFDGEKIFVVNMSENSAVVEVDANGSDVEHLAEKISIACSRNGWKTSAVGFCLRDDDVVTLQTEVDNIPAREIFSLVKIWAVAQVGNDDAAFSFAKVGEQLWMETLPKKTVDEFSAAWKKFGMNLRGLSAMPVDLLTKFTATDRAKFIAEVVRDRKVPNVLATRSVFDWKRISAAVAAIFFIALLISSTKIFFDNNAASTQLDAAKISVNELRDDISLKNSHDADISELNRLNKICAAQGVNPAKFNLLINLGKVAGGGVHLTKIHADENFLELEGISTTPDAVKSYLSRVKSSVIQSARLESSVENKDGDIVFTIRATLKDNSK